jgi:CHAT domain-containing protein/tetratricopeptide (TPR) repeat protein
LAVLRASRCGLLPALLSCWLLSVQGRTQEPMPKPLTDQQRERLKERDRLFSEVQKLAKAGKLEEANAVFEKKLAIEREVFGEVHAVVADSLAMLARGYEARQDFAAARKGLQEVVAIRVKLNGEKDWRVTDARLALADLGVREKLGPAQRARLVQATRLNYQGYQLWQQGKPAEALPLMQQALAIRKEVLGECHRDYAPILNNVAYQYRDMGQYLTALPLLEQARDLTRKLLGEEHPEYPIRLINLATLYKDMGNYPRALPLLEQARELTRKLRGEEHPDYATCLHNLAGTCKDMGDFSRALLLAEQARDLTRKLLGEQHPEYAYNLSSLALLYQALGDYPKALPLAEQARDLTRKLLGEKHPDYATSLQSLARLYQEMGDYPRALPLVEQVRDLTRKLQGEEHPDYATCLHNLALLYQDMGDYPRALPLSEQARELTRKLRGEEHPDYAISLNNLASLYKAMGDYPRALPLAEQARDLIRKLRGEKHPDYATSLNNLASLYKALGDSPRAITLYQQALELRQATGNVRHPDYATTLSNLACLFLALGDFPQAEQWAHQALVARQQHLSDTFAAQSQRQRLDLLSQSRSSLEVYLSVIAGASFPSARVYQQVLAWKGSLAARQAEDCLASDNPAFRDQLEQLRVVRAGLARLVANPPLPAAQPAWLKTFQDLEEQKEKLELKLAQLSQEFYRLRQRLQASPAQLARNLPQDAALVDFLEYNHGTPDPARKGHWRFQRRLLAFVLRRDGEPALMHLGPVEPIATAVQAWRLPITAIPPAPPDQKTAEQLARRLWQPLRQHLADARTVLIAPDGELCGLPFAALPGSKPDTFLLEEVAIGYLTSGRHLLETADPRMPSEGLLALGGLDFGKPDPTRLAEGLLSRFSPWSYLVGSQLELEQVERSWGQNFPKEREPQRLSGPDIDKVRLQRELAASKEGPRWRYLHLATHGFFTPPEPQPQRALPKRGDLFALEQNRLTYQRNPLLLSGLVLSQANRNPDTGLMTAEEVAALDLRGVELAVLSACETGLGRVADGQGVYGLQRAFQEAGAKSLLVSLWSVSDPATSLLMQEFYAQLWSAKPPSKLEALRRAQMKLLHHPELIEARKQELLLALKDRKQAEVALRGPGKVSVLLPQGGKVEAEPSRSHPAYWAPFVLSGDWR